MNVAGLPLHPLVVHAAVVLIPLSALLVIGFALFRSWRWLTRWPAAVAAVGSIGLAYLATTSGKALLNARPELRPLVQVHQARGNLLALETIPLAVLVLIAAFLLPGPSGLASGKGARESRVAALDVVLPVIVVLAALAVLVQVVLTGDAGARALWG
jgi:hypothetical protein